MSDTLLAAAVLGVGAEATGVTNFTPIGAGGDDDQTPVGGGGMPSIELPSQAGPDLSELAAVLQSNRPRDTGPGLDELAAVFESVQDEGNVAERIAETRRRFEERLDEQSDRFEERREEWEEKADDAKETATNPFAGLNYTIGGDDRDEQGGDGSDTNSLSDELLRRYGEGEPLTPNLVDVGDPAGFFEQQVDTAVGAVNPNDPRGFESPTNDLPETGKYGAVGDFILGGVDSVKEFADNDTGKVEETAELFRKATTGGEGVKMADRKLREAAERAGGGSSSSSSSSSGGGSSSGPAPGSDAFDKKVQEKLKGAF
jgi:hypothetical protein